MAIYRFTYSDATVDPFTDSQYNVYVAFIIASNAGVNELVTFGDPASKNAAIAALTAVIEASWTANGVTNLFSIKSFTITEGTQSVSVELTIEVSDTLFIGNSITPYYYSFMISGASLWAADMSVMLSGTPSVTNSITGVVDCTPVACDKCQEVVFSACQASYTIIAGLGSGTDYTVVLTDRNNVRYTQLITADTSGDLTIDTTDIPSSLFTPESGGFLVEVYEDAELTTKATITSGYYTYGCIQLSFQHTVTTTSSIPVQFNFLYTENDFVIDEYGNTFICN